MLVYFSGSARAQENVETYRKIIQTIKEEGGIIAHGWTEAAAARPEFPRDRLWWEMMCEDVQNGLNDANVVIAEVSGASVMGVGFEVAYALNAGKPVLGLIAKGQEGYSYAYGLKHELLILAFYSPQTLSGHVKNFLAENRV